jgi:hypothetical protein
MRPKSPEKPKANKNERKVHSRDLRGQNDPIRLKKSHLTSLARPNRNKNK